MGAGAGVRHAGSGAAVFGRHAAGTGGRPAGNGAAAGGRWAGGCPSGAGGRRPAGACWPAVLRWSWVPGWSAMPCWPGVVRCLRRPQRRGRVGAFPAAACPPAAAAGPPAAGGGPAGAAGAGAGPAAAGVGPPGVAVGPPGVDVCLGAIGGRAVSRESRRVGGNSSGTAVSGSHGVSWPAHGSTGGVVAQSVGSSEAGSGGSAGAGRRRDHQARFGSGGGTAAAPLQRAGACAVAGSVVRGSLPTLVGSALRRESSERPAAVVPVPALSSGSPAAGVASPGCWSAIRRSPPGAVLGRLSPG
jgi:hypothetical protein